MKTLKQNKECSSKSNLYLLKRENIEKAIIYWNAKITCFTWLSISRKKKRKENKKVGYIMPTMNCYPRNGLLIDPDFTRGILYHSNQYQYLQPPILWVVLNISKNLLTTRLTRVL